IPAPLARHTTLTLDQAPRSTRLLAPASRNARWLASSGRDGAARSRMSLQNLVVLLEQAMPLHTQWKACPKNSDNPRAGTQAHYAAAQAGPMAPLPTRARPAQEKSVGRTSEFYFRRPAVRRIESDLCSSQAAHAGSCPRPRRCRDADRKRRVRRDRAGAQTVSRESRYWQGRNRRRARPIRLQPPLFGGFARGARSSGQALQEALNQNRELLAHGQADLGAENVVITLRNLFQ